MGRPCGHLLEFGAVLPRHATPQVRGSRYRDKCRAPVAGQPPVCAPQGGARRPLEAFSRYPLPRRCRVRKLTRFGGPNSPAGLLGWLLGAVGRGRVCGQQPTARTPRVVNLDLADTGPLASRVETATKSVMVCLGQPQRATGDTSHCSRGDTVRHSRSYQPTRDTRNGWMSTAKRSTTRRPTQANGASRVASHCESSCFSEIRIVEEHHLFPGARKLSQH